MSRLTPGCVEDLRDAYASALTLSRPSLVIYTASFGGHDQPQEIYGLPPDALPICFTDDPALTRKTWKVIVRPRVFAHPRMDAKWYKMSACHLFPGMSHSIYIDSSIWVWDAKGFIDKCLIALFETGTQAGFFGHPEGQTTLRGEAIHSLSMPKYEGAALLQQVNHYEQAGFPGGTIFAGGVIARAHTPVVSTFEKAWFDECVHWSVQDQVSLPYVIWNQRLVVARISGDIYHDDHHLYLWSGPK